ncbi:MAG: hypothetical protein Q9212_003709 [Teloschistes hypoglaucus]
MLASLMLQATRDVYHETDLMLTISNGTLHPEEQLTTIPTINISAVTSLIMFVARGYMLANRLAFPTLLTRILISLLANSMGSPQTCPEGQTKEIQDGGSGNEELWSVAVRCDSRSPSPTLSNDFAQGRTYEDDADPPSNTSGIEHVGGHSAHVAMRVEWQNMFIDIDNLPPSSEVPVLRPSLPQSIISSSHDTLQNRHRHVREAVSETEMFGRPTAVAPSMDASSSHRKSTWDPRQSYPSTESLLDPEKCADNDGLQHQVGQRKTRTQRHALRLVLVYIAIFLIALCWQRNSFRF